MAARRRNKKKKRLARVIVPIAAFVTVAVVLFMLFGLTGTQKKPKLYLNTEYAELITDQAGENGFPPAFAAAVITAESSFDPQAVSSVNARGLMQLMPDTAEWIAGKFGETVGSPDELFDPETNIRYGCWYLGYLFRRYNGNLTNAAAAYHQGQGTVDKWLEDPAISADGITLTDIPSDVTRHYVEKVLTYYEAYHEEIYP